MEIIAEVGLAHDGSLGQAHAYIDACAQAGVQMVKFQCHLPEESNPDEPWRIVPRWAQDENRFFYWIRTGFQDHEWDGLKEHCDVVGVEFLCSPFSRSAVSILDPLVKRWKIASGEITNMPVLRAIAATRKPVLISTGMATVDEMDRVTDFFGDQGIPYQLMQCTSKYPTAPEDVGLYEAAAMGGLSDHSGQIWSGLAAAALGVRVYETHVVWDKECWGFDTSSSITIDELCSLVDGVKFIEAAKGPVSKDKMAAQLTDMRSLFLDKWKRV